MKTPKPKPTLATPLTIESHVFRHMCKSGNMLIGAAVIRRNKATKMVAGSVGWATSSVRPQSTCDTFEYAFEWIPAVTNALCQITGKLPEL